MAVLDKYEVKIYCVAGDQVGINVRNYRVQAEVGGGIPPQDMADQLAALFSFPYRGWLSAAARYMGVTVQLQNVLPPITAPSIGILGQGDGMNANDMLPRQVAGLIRYKTNGAGRHARGRSYIPFGAENYNDADGKVGAAGQAALDVLRVALAAIQTLTVGANSVTLVPQVRNRSTNDYSLIATAVADDRWATQKRRGSFGRTNPIPF